MMEEMTTTEKLVSAARTRGIQLSKDDLRFLQETPFSGSILAKWSELNLSPECLLTSEELLLYNNHFVPFHACTEKFQVE